MVGGVLSTKDTVKLHEALLPDPSTALIVTVVGPEISVPAAGLCVIVGEAVQASVADAMLV